MSCTAREIDIPWLHVQQVAALRFDVSWYTQLLQVVDFGGLRQAGLTHMAPVFEISAFPNLVQIAPARFEITLASHYVLIVGLAEKYQVFWWINHAKIALYLSVMAATRKINIVCNPYPCDKRFLWVCRLYQMLNELELNQGSPV